MGQNLRKEWPRGMFSPDYPDRLLFRVRGVATAGSEGQQVNATIPEIKEKTVFHLKKFGSPSINLCMFFPLSGHPLLGSNDRRAVPTSELSR